MKLDAFNRRVFRALIRGLTLEKKINNGLEYEWPGGQS